MLFPLPRQEAFYFLARIANHSLLLVGVIEFFLFTEKIRPENIFFSLNWLDLDIAPRTEFLVARETIGQMGHLHVGLRMGKFVRFQNDVVLVINRLLFGDDGKDDILEVVGRLPHLFVGSAPGEQIEPGFQIGMVFLRIAQVLNPSFQRFGVQVVLLGDRLRGRTRLLHHFPSRYHVPRGLGRQNFSEQVALLVGEFVESRFLVPDSLLMLLVIGYGFSGNQRILAILRTRKNAGQRVIVRLGDWIVLMIVAARASCGQTEEAARQGVNAVLALVSPGQGRLDDVVVPRTEAEETGRCQKRVFLFAALARQQIASNLRFDEQVVRQVVVEGLDDPVAVTESIRIGFYGNAAHIIFTVTRHVQPIAAPTLSVMRGGQQAVHNPGKGIGGGVLQEGFGFLGGRRQTNQVKISAPDQSSLIRRRGRLQPLILQPSQDEMVDGGFRPSLVSDFRQRGFVRWLERPKRPLLGGHDKFFRLGSRGRQVAVFGPRSPHLHPCPEVRNLLLL